MRFRKAPWIGLASVLLAMVTATAALAQLDDVLIKGAKVLGIGYVVKTFGGQINSFVNTVLQQHGAAYEGTTRVVPILRVGSGGYVGAAQVVGRPDIVSTVKGVAEGQLDIDRARLRYLVPITSLSLSHGLPPRTNGVGVSAVIDFRI